jgi:hypothetical protein
MGKLMWEYHMISNPTNFFFHLRNMYIRRKLLKFVWRTIRLHHKMLSAKSKALTGHFSRYAVSYEQQTSGSSRHP